MNIVCDEGITNKQIAALIVIMLITLIIGSYYVHAHLYRTEFGHDEANYIEMARRWADSGTYSYGSDEPNAFVPPGLPIFLTLCYKIFGFEAKGLAAIRVVQLFFTVITNFLVYIYGYQLTGKRSVGIIAAALISINLNIYMYACGFLTENIYFLSLMIFAVVFTAAQRQEKLWPHFVSGVLFCICVMIRSAIVVVILFIYLPMFSRTKANMVHVFKCAALFFLGFVIVGIPWWIRNIVVLDELILFCKQNHVIFHGMASGIESQGFDRPDSVREYLSLFLTTLKNDPKSTLYWYSFEKFEILFMEYSYDMFSVIAAVAKNIVVFLGLPVCVMALFSKRSFPIVINFFAYMLVVFIGVPSSRYGLQFLFFLSVAAAWVLDTASRKLFNK